MQNETIKFKIKNSQETVNQIELFINKIIENNLEKNPIYLNEIIKSKLILHKNLFLLYQLRKQIKLQLLYSLEEPLPNTIIAKWNEEEIDLALEKHLPYLQTKIHTKDTIQTMYSINKTIENIEEISTKIEQIEQNIQPKQKIKSKLLHFIYKIKSP